jgi:hypothetical protein
VSPEAGRRGRERTARLDGDVDDRKRLAPKFDGTIGSLADCYESDEDSAYQGLKENSAEGYKAWLKMVRETVGLRNVSRIVAKEFRRWYRMWKARSSSRGTDGKLHWLNRTRYLFSAPRGAIHRLSIEPRR